MTLICIKTCSETSLNILMYYDITDIQVEYPVNDNVWWPFLSTWKQTSGLKYLPCTISKQTDNRRNNKRLTITWGGGSGVDPFLSPFLLLAGDGGGAGLGVVGGGT